MKTIIELQKKLFPDLVTIIQKRYHILQYIGAMEPVGRRNLSTLLGVTERVLRSEVEYLKQQELITSNNSGMSLTIEGRDLVQGLQDYIRDISGIDVLETQLRHILGIKQVFIVPGNSDHLVWVKNEIGKTCVKCINQYLKEKNIIAVTGGSTMAAVADMMTPISEMHECLFVPARGGIGENVQNQANTICSKMAERTGYKHRVLYVPDQVSKEMYNTLIKDPNIHEVLSLINSANIVLHGIGDAMTMAKRRKSNEDELSKLQELQAVGEAFGYYFNEAGNVVHKVQTIGLQLEELSTAEHVIAVSGGASKAKAIKSYMKQAPSSTILITDEGAALQLLRDV